MSATLLSARGLVRRYRGRTVVDVDALDVRRGEVLVVLGPNGAGKSTLFRLLALLERPDAGTILLDGQEVAPGDRDARSRIAGVFQRPYLFDGTVAANVAYGLRARGLAAAERTRRIEQALEWLEITELAGASVRTLSGGEAQRVALARALVVEPDLLLLDEPTANLDVGVRRLFREDLERLARRRARAAVLITHDPGDAFALADTVAVMHAGRIVQTGTPEQLVLEPATPFIAAFTGAELLLDGVVRSVDDDLVTVELGEGLCVTALADRLEAVSGDRVHVAYRPEDVVLATEEHAGLTSAINRFSLRVDALFPAGGLVRVRLSEPLPLSALVTRRSAEALGLEAGRAVVAQVKATALRAFPAA